MRDAIAFHGATSSSSQEHIGSTLVHFIFGLADDPFERQWSYAHYVAVRSAYVHISHAKLLFHYHFAPIGLWWNRTVHLFHTLHRVDLPTSIFGRPLVAAAHRADVLRLQLLLEHGGIYLDLDVVVVADLRPLLRYDFAIGREGHPDHGGFHGLCNAVLVSRPNASFARRWLATYSTFGDASAGDKWSGHSVQMPFRLSKLYPSEVHLLPYTAFFWPDWDEQMLKKLLLEHFETFEAFSAPGLGEGGVRVGASAGGTYDKHRLAMRGHRELAQGHPHQRGHDEEGHAQSFEENYTHHQHRFHDQNDQQHQAQPWQQHALHSTAMTQQPQWEWRHDHYQQRGAPSAVTSTAPARYAFHLWSSLATPYILSRWSAEYLHSVPSTLNCALAQVIGSHNEENSAAASSLKARTHGQMQTQRRLGTSTPNSASKSALRAASASAFPPESASSPSLSSATRACTCAEFSHALEVADDGSRAAVALWPLRPANSRSAHLVQDVRGCMHGWIYARACTTLATRRARGSRTGDADFVASSLAAEPNVSTRVQTSRRISQIGAARGPNGDLGSEMCWGLAPPFVGGVGLVFGKWMEAFVPLPPSPLRAFSVSCWAEIQSLRPRCGDGVTLWSLALASGAISLELRPLAVGLSPLVSSSLPSVQLPTDQWGARRSTLEATGVTVCSTGWHHYLVSATFDSQTLRLYIDGILVSSVRWDGPSGLKLSPRGLWIGSHEMKISRRPPTHLFPTSAQRVSMSHLALYTEAIEPSELLSESVRPSDAVLRGWAAQPLASLFSPSSMRVFLSGRILRQRLQPPGADTELHFNSPVAATCPACDGTQEAEAALVLPFTSTFMAADSTPTYTAVLPATFLGICMQLAFTFCIVLALLAFLARRSRARRNRRLLCFSCSRQSSQQASC